MVKQIILEIFLLFNFIILFSNNLEAQIWRDVVPLKTTRQDVVKTQKGEQKLPDGSSFFELPEDAVTVKYYESGCSKSDEEKLGLFPDVVIEMKGVPKIELPLEVFLGGSIANLEKIPLSDSQNIYVNFNVGFIIITETFLDKPELVKKIFYIPQKVTKLPACLLQTMNPFVQQAFKLSKVNERQFKGTFFSDYIHLRYPEFTRTNIEYLTNFTELLRKAIDSKGYIIVYAGKESRRNEANFWINELEKHLIEKNKIDKEKISFINGGFRSYAEAMLLIVPNGIGPPNTTPTILPNQVKTISNTKQKSKRRK